MNKKEETTSEQTEKNPKEDIPAEETPKEEIPKKETIGDTLKDNSPKEEKPTVGLDKFLDLKKENKQLKQEFDEFKASIEQGANKKEIAADIEALAREHNVDPDFLEKLASEIQSKAERSIDEKLRPLTEREAKATREKVFQERLKETLEEMPEYKDVINIDIVKQLAFNPENANKTFAGLLEEMYGTVVTGERKTLETTTPTSKGAPEKLDYDKALSDTKYFNEVMADPELKKEYNERMLSKHF